MLALHGWDNCKAGVTAVATDEPQETYTERIVENLVLGSGGSEELAEWIGDMTNMGLGAGAGMSRAASLLKTKPLTNEEILQLGQGPLRAEVVEEFQARGAEWFDDAALRATRNPDSDNLVRSSSAQRAVSR